MKIIKELKIYKRRYGITGLAEIVIFLFVVSSLLFSMGGVICLVLSFFLYPLIVRSFLEPKQRI